MNMNFLNSSLNAISQIHFLGRKILVSLPLLHATWLYILLQLQGNYFVHTFLENYNYNLQINVLKKRLC